jgi:guanylate kinase
MKKIFCLVGKTGSGKSSYLSDIMNIANNDNMNLKRLIYCTTRPKRENEKDGVDYYFRKITDIFNTDDIIELREYNTIGGVWNYYTDKKCLENGDNFITAASIDQLANYIKYSNEMSYTKDGEGIKAYQIYIDCPIKTRLERVIKNRCNSDEDVEELCRRIVQERIDYSEPAVLSFINNMPKEDTITVDNNSSLVRAANIRIIVDWIKERI